MKLRDASAHSGFASTERAQGVTRFGAIHKPGGRLRFPIMRARVNCRAARPSPYTRKNPLYYRLPKRV